jgi:hypothetical protein
MEDICFFSFVCMVGRIHSLIRFWHISIGFISERQQALDGILFMA